MYSLHYCTYRGRCIIRSWFFFFFFFGTSESKVGINKQKEREGDMLASEHEQERPVYVVGTTPGCRGYSKNTHFWPTLCVHCGPTRGSAAVIVILLEPGHSKCKLVCAASVWKWCWSLLATLLGQSKPWGHGSSMVWVSIASLQEISRYWWRITQFMMICYVNKDNLSEWSSVMSQLITQDVKIAMKN